MNKTEKLKNATQNVTYLDIIRCFNNLNSTLRGEYYASGKDLVAFHGKRLPGFIYTGYAAGVGIRRILDAIGIRYVTRMNGGSGIYEESEIYIEDEKSKKRIMDIFEKTGMFYSNVSVDLNTTILDKQLIQHIR